jgi:hypothetical protein
MIILVRVIGFEMLDPEQNSIPAHATMLVIKSWKGPFCAGDVLQTFKGFISINGIPEDFISYPFQPGDQGKYFLIMDNGGPHAPDKGPSCAGEQFLIMDNGGPPPPELFVRRNSAWPAEKSQALIAALDQAVAQAVADSVPTDKKGYLARLQKERAAIEDLETKLQAVRDRRTALEKQLPGDEEAFNQTTVELNSLNYLASGHIDRAARWQQKLRTLGWRPPSCDPAAPCARASAP